MRVRFLIGLLLAGILWLPALVVGQEATPSIPPGITIHVVQRGETLSLIAQRLGTTTGTLVRLNNIADESNIQVGQRLLVPIAGETPRGSPSILHVVQPGETVASIARIYGLTAEELSARNNLIEPSSFYVGVLLDVSRLPPAPTDAPSMPADMITDTPTETAAEELPAAELPVEASATPAPETPVPEGTPVALVRHTVSRGETLFRIAQRYGVTVNALAQINNISDPTLIYAGQELVIPGLEAPAQPDTAIDLPAPATSLNISPLVFVEGRTGRIQLTTATGIIVGGTFLGQTLHDAAEAENTSHTMLVGIPVGTTAGIYPLELTMVDGAGARTPITVNIQVTEGNYRREYIQLLADRAGLLDPAVEAAELDLLRSTTSTFTPTRYFDGAMGLPAAAPLSSPFGSTRSYNGGEFSRIHTGTDFASASGAPILAPAAGRVVYVGAFDVRGNVTILDHGWGVFTVYCHQTESYVAVGDTVTARQVIGTAGSTGRVTGSHLHWELWVGGVAVNPMQWVQEPFT